MRAYLRDRARICRGKRLKQMPQRLVQILNQLVITTINGYLQLFVASFFLFLPSPLTSVDITVGIHTLQLYISFLTNIT